MKWFGIPKTSWHPANGLIGTVAKYIELVEEFEKCQAQLIIGMSENDLAPLFAVKFKHGEVQLVQLNEVKIKFPNLLKNFLLERIQFKKLDQPVNVQVNQQAQQDVESRNIVFFDENAPTRIIGMFALLFLLFRASKIYFVPLQ